MTTDRHNSGNGNLPVHADVSFESSDINISSVIWALFYLSVTVVISVIICIYFLKYTTKFVESQDTPRPVVRQALSSTDQVSASLPPEPRLQGVPGHENDPQRDLREKLAQDNTANERLGWIDEKSGVAQIPVKDAMRIIAEKGLPSVAVAAPEKKK